MLGTWFEFGGSGCDRGIDSFPVAGPLALESPGEGAGAPDEREPVERMFRRVGKFVVKTVNVCVPESALMFE